MNAITLHGPQIVILAAGFSLRLGYPKALARVRASSLLRSTLNVVSPLTRAKIILVIPHRAIRYRIEARGFNVIFATNRRRGEGLSSSVRRGISIGRYSPALLLLPVDLAGLQQRDLVRLLSRWHAARRCVVARRVPPPNGSRHAGATSGGVPLILPRWLYARALQVTGDRGLREMVGELPLAQRVLVDLPSAALDVDTPQDLNAARCRHPPSVHRIGARIKNPNERLAHSAARGK
jgi:molybdenum cofactor cytidylyltransferase